MNEKYQYMFLMYMYNLLGLKDYEKSLEEAGIQKIEYSENGDLFKYFSLLSSGDTELFTDEESAELELLSSHELKDILDSDVLKSKCENFLNRTYRKYFFSNSTGKDYVYYGPLSSNYMAPDDAITLGINYRKFIEEKENEDYEETLSRQEDAVYSVINDIQESRAPSLNLKVAVIEQTELTLSKPSITL